MNTPACPVCTLTNTYPDGEQLVCADCGHEWSASDVSADDDVDKVVRDSNGNVLENGDSVILIKDLKVKGSAIVLKKGTKVKNIRIVDGDHDIDCKIDGIGQMGLKSQFVKKA